jgi:prepilin-type N-terminal cleavage/methylation domain-containing protein
MKRQRGFTLVEIAIVLAVISLLVGGALNLQQSVSERNKLELTERRVAAILKAIDQFVDYHGYLPCPANPLATFAAGDFGVGTNDARHFSTSASVDPTDANSGSNNCAAPVNANVIAIAPGGANLALGGVPVHTLRLAPNFAVDGWNNRFTYVIDQSLAFRGDGLNTTSPTATRGYTFNTISGQIVLDRNGTTLRSDIAVMVISHGANGYGAWPGRGGARIDITGGTNEEDENTDDDITFNQPFRSLTSDDVVSYLTKWQLDAERSF